MQKHQRPLHRGVDVLHFRAQQQVAVDGLVQFFEMELHQEIGAGRGIGRNLGQEGVEHQGASRRRFSASSPIAVQLRRTRTR